MGTDYYDLVIATPGTSMLAPYVRSLVQTFHWAQDQGLSIGFLNGQSSIVSQAREKTATNSDGSNWAATQIADGEFGCDRILWIDSDMEWTPKDIEMLWDTELDVVGALCATSATTVGCWQPRAEGDGLPGFCTALDFFMMDTPVKVGGIGFGFTMIFSSVFEAIPRPWFMPLEVTYPETGFPTPMGEDYSFCERAKTAGFDIYVHPAVRIKHWKTSALEVQL